MPTRNRTDRRTADAAKTSLQAFITCRLDYCNSLLYGQTPAYLASDIQLIADSNRPLQLRSASETICIVPRTHDSFGDRSFSAAGPRVWNTLPTYLRQDTNWKDTCLGCRRPRRIVTVVFVRRRSSLTYYLLTYKHLSTGQNITPNHCRRQRVGTFREKDEHKENLWRMREFVRVSTGPAHIERGRRIQTTSSYAVPWSFSFRHITARFIFVRGVFRGASFIASICHPHARRCLSSHSQRQYIVPKYYAANCIRWVTVISPCSLSRYVTGQHAHKSNRQNATAKNSSLEVAPTISNCFRWPKNYTAAVT